MVFETKKIQLETLGEYLREVRSKLGMSKEEVSKKLSIKLQFLENLENGIFEKLPADVYVVGFLKQMAQFYTIDAKPLLEQYKKERIIERQLNKKSRYDRAVVGYPFGRFVVTPKTITVFFGFIFVVLTLGYIVWQVSSINKTPSLEIFEPQDGQVVQNSAVTVRGKTNPGMQLTINDQSVFVNERGEFKTELGIGNGPKQLTFMVKNKFDKSVTKNMTIIGVINQIQPNQDGLVKLRLDFSDVVVLKFKLDDAPEQTITFQKGDIKILTASKKIVISTSNAGATSVIYNDTAIGVLGRQGESITNIPFFQQSTPVNVNLDVP